MRKGINAVRRKYSLHEVAIIGFGLTVAVFVVAAVVGYRNVRLLSKNEQQVAHTHEVMGELEALLSTLMDAETGQRGYLLTEDQNYLQPYSDGLRRVDASVLEAPNSADR